MQNLIGYIHHQTIYAVIRHRIYVGNRALRASPAQANGIGTRSFGRWSCLSETTQNETFLHSYIRLPPDACQPFYSTVFSPGTRSSVLISAKHISLGISLNCMIRKESPSSELRENVLSSDPRAKILSLDQAPQVIRFECFPRIGVRLMIEVWNVYVYRAASINHKHESVDI